MLTQKKKICHLALTQFSTSNRISVVLQQTAGATLERFPILHLCGAIRLNSGDGHMDSTGGASAMETPAQGNAAPWMLANLLQCSFFMTVLHKTLRRSYQGQHLHKQCKELFSAEFPCLFLLLVKLTNISIAFILTNRKSVITNTNIIQQQAFCAFIRWNKVEHHADAYVCHCRPAVTFLYIL